MMGRRESVIALIILLAAGVFFRSLSHGENIPVHHSLATFPLQIGPWVGEVHTLAPNVLQVLKVDDYLWRQYGGMHGPPLGLYIGYYQSMRQGATYHSPKNCLPGSGWYFVETGKIPLQATDGHGQPVEINKFIIQKGLDKQLVLYWYQDRGRVLTSEYWAKAYMILDALLKHRTDGAFIRITVPFLPETEAEAFAQGKAFAEQLFPLLQRYLPS
jgi:EpsI family protein